MLITIWDKKFFDAHKALNTHKPPPKNCGRNFYKYKSNTCHMGNEILFRAKRAGTMEWIFGMPVSGCSRMIAEGQQTGTESISIISNTIGQFTGLYDIHSNKIFVGDMVRFTYKAHLFKAVIVTGHFGYRYLPVDEVSRRYISLVQPPGEDLEIVGNIHDNPEMSIYLHKYNQQDKSYTGYPL